MRAVLYCRVSSAEQVQNLSLPTQEKACREYAERQGFSVDRVFVDRGESARTTDRPEFQAMLTYCRKSRGKVHAVIVYGLSRFSRNNADHHAIAALLRGQGISLRSVTEPIDDTPAGRFMEAVIAGMAQFDNDMRADRSRAGLKAAAERGRWCWHPPTGYRSGRHRQGEASLVPHPEYGPLVARAFQQLADTDRSIADICRELQAAGLKGRGGRAISLETLQGMLRNAVYTGQLRSPGLEMTRQGDWAPLVLEDVWDRVQLRLGQDGRARRRDTAHPDFPLRTFVYCGSCQRPLTAGWTKGRNAKYAYYRCPKNCAGINTPKARLEAAFVEHLNRLRPNADWLDLARAMAGGWRTELDDARSTRGQLEATRTRIESQIRRLEDAYLFEQAIDQETLDLRRAELREQRTLTVLALEQATIDAEQIEGAIAEAIDALHQAASLWIRARTTDARQRLQRAVLPDGVVWTGSALLNRGSRCCCFELAGAEGGMVAEIPLNLHQIEAWRRAWRAFRDVA